MVEALRGSGGLRHLQDNLLIILHLFPPSLPLNAKGEEGCSNIKELRGVCSLFNISLAS